MQKSLIVVPSADSVKFASEIEDQRSELLTADLRQGPVNKYSLANRNGQTRAAARARRLIMSRPPASRI